ncbi:MAG: hypothetical protein U0T56_02380 [Ferruginibacter sp.]
MTLTGSNGCDSVATLNLTLLPTTTSTTNQSVCPTQLLTPGTDKHIMEQELIRDTHGKQWFNSVATLNLTLPPTTTSTTNQSVCPTQLPYTWNGQTL